MAKSGKKSPYELHDDPKQEADLRQVIEEVRAAASDPYRSGGPDITTASNKCRQYEVLLRKYAGGQLYNKKGQLMGLSQSGITYGQFRQMVQRVCPWSKLPEFEPAQQIETPASKDEDSRSGLRTVALVATVGVVAAGTIYFVFLR